MKDQGTTVVLRALKLISSIGCFSTTLLETVKQQIDTPDKMAIQ